MLEHPALVEAVQQLPPPQLAALVERIGLEDAGELVALATTEQLGELLDEDLWRNERPGEDEVFDAERFSTWLHVLLEAGEGFAAARFAELPEELLTLALHRQVLVLDADVLERELGAGDPDEADQVDKALTSCLREELDQYVLLSRRQDGWDDVLTLVLALDREHHALLRRVLDRCCDLTAAHVEEHGGLYEVLSDEEMLESDARGDRDDRRTGRGHVAPSDARAFLRLARLPDAGVPPGEHDAVTRAVLRQVRDAEGGPSRRRAPAPVAPPEGPAVPGLPEWLAGIEAPASLPPAPRLAPEGADPTSPREPLLTRALRGLREEDASAWSERMEELAYLSNLLIAGATVRARRYRPIEALEAVAATCSLGLELAAAVPELDAPEAAALLRWRPADDLFRLAHGHLHREVTLPAARALVARLSGGAEVTGSRSERLAVAAALREAAAAGAPWNALPRLLGADVGEPVELVDTFAGLLDECPACAGLLARRGPSARGKPTPIASRADLARAAAFLARPDDPLVRAGST